MRIALSVLILLTIINSHAQELKVLHSKKSFIVNGKKIKVGDQLNLDDSVWVKEKGILTLDIDYPRDLTMETGKYHLASLIEKLKADYTRHKIVLAKLEERELANCKFRYQVFVVPGSNKHYEADRISIEKHRIKRYQCDSSILNVTWKNPDLKYNGSHFVILQQGYGHQLLIDIIEFEGTEAFFNLANYDEQFMTFTIQAEDCRASLPNKITNK